MGLQGFNIEVVVTRPKKKMTKSQSVILQHYQDLCKKANADNGRLCPIVNLKNYHAWITMYLIQRFTRGGEHILDLACGKGGDLLKWEKAKVKSYVGVDMVECLLEEAKRRHTKGKCTFSAQFICEDGFGSMLLQELGLANQGNHEGLLFEEFGLKNKSHDESLFIKDLELNNQGHHHEKIIFKEKELTIQGLQKILFSHDLGLVKQVPYDSFLFQELSLKNIIRCHESFFLLDKSTNNEGYIKSILLMLELVSKNQDLVQSLLSKKSKKQSLDADMVVQKCNYLRHKLGLIVEGSNKSFVHQNWLGLTNGNCCESFIQYVEPSKKKKENHVSLVLQKNRRMNSDKGVHKSLDNANENINIHVDIDVQGSMENVKKNENATCVMEVHGEGPLKQGVEGKFDVCSCQFALHYAWSSEERARGAMNNVSMLLKHGGYFIGTIPDANVVLKRLQEAATNKDNFLQKSGGCERLYFGNKVYNLKFNIANGTRALSLAREINQNTELGTVNTIDNMKDLVKSFGIEYEFHLEGAVEHCPEWLVPFHSLVSLANQYGLELVFAINFEELLFSHNNHQQLLFSQKHNCSQQNFLSFESPLPHGIPSADELECMSLYLAFAFQKQATPF